MTVSSPRSAPISVASGKRLLIGTSSSRTASVAACSDTARFTGTLASSVAIFGTTPAVETVTLRGPSAKRLRVQQQRADSITAGRFSSGSPMPM